MKITSNRRELKVDNVNIYDTHTHKHTHTPTITPYLFRNITEILIGRISCQNQLLPFYWCFFNLKDLYLNITGISVAFQVYLTCLSVLILFVFLQYSFPWSTEKGVM